MIVDANVATQIFAANPTEDFQPIWDALLARKAIAIHGGKPSEEYAQITSIRRLLLELERQGIVRKVPDASVNTATSEYASRALQSDDPHILGLAKVSSVRLLCSHDQDLHADFTNSGLLRPLGCVYQNASHRHLIRRYCSALKKKARKHSRVR